MNLPNSYIYRSDTHDFFDELALLLIGFSSFSAAVESFRSASSTRIPTTPDHPLILNGRTVTVSWRSFELMHRIARNIWPTELEVVFSTRSIQPIPSTNGIELQSEGIFKMVVHLVGTMFLKFYERNVAVIMASYPNHQRTWPLAWRFGWLIRNAIAHGDRFDIRDPSFPAVTWNGVTISPADNNAPWFDINRYIAGGDVLLLMNHMLKELATQA